MTMETKEPTRLTSPGRSGWPWRCSASFSSWSSSTSRSLTWRCPRSRWISVSRRRSPVGHQRLRTRVRRVPAPRRASRRHLGRRRLFLVGVVVFTLASLLAGLAWSDTSLIAARVAPGPGRGGHHSRGAVDPVDDLHRRPRAQHRARRLGRGRWLRRRGRRTPGRRPDRCAELGVDLLRQRPGRRGCLRCAPFLLEESRDADVKKFDLPGAVLVTGGLSTLVYAVTQAGQEGWLAGETLGSSRSLLPCWPASSCGSSGTRIR